MKSWILIVALALVALSSGLPVPADDASSKSSETVDAPEEVFSEEDVDDAESNAKLVRSIAENDSKYIENPAERIQKALENVQRTLSLGIKNLGNSAIQILEGTGVATEQALGTGARIITGAAESAAEAADVGTKSLVRVANGVADSLTKGTKALVDTKTQLLKGLTGASPSALQADASSNSESVQRNERANTGFGGGYGSGASSFGPNTVAETPNNFVNVFSQAAANTVNFGTQLLNSLVGVAANILQGTVSTLLSLLNAKGQVVGAVVQSAPPVLASVTRTAGDVLAAKARIFGAVTQGMTRLVIGLFNDTVNTMALVLSRAADVKGRVLSSGGKAVRISVGATTMAISHIYEAAVQFGSQLARTFGDTFSGLLNRQGGEAGSSPIAQLAQLFSGLTSGARGLAGGSGGGGSGSANLLGGVGNFAQSVINTKLNLLNGLLSPFTGGRPLLNFGNRGSSSSSSSSSGSSSFSEPNFRISISSASTPSSSSISVSSPSDSSSSASSSSTTKSTGPRYARFPAESKARSELSTASFINTFRNGMLKGLVDELNKDPLLGSFDNSGSFSSQILPKKDDTANAQDTLGQIDDKQLELFSKILPLAFNANNFNLYN